MVSAASHGSTLLIADWQAACISDAYTLMPAPARSALLTDPRSRIATATQPLPPTSPPAPPPWPPDPLPAPSAQVLQALDVALDCIE